MPESTVAQSILGTLGQVAGISGRRAQDGLTAQQAQSYAIKNEADRRILQDDEDASLFGELEDLGFVSVDRATGKATIDGERLANENPELLARFIGPEANRFLSTKTDNGSQPVSFVGVKKVDPRIAQDPALGAYPQELAAEGPAPASNYVVQLRTQDGRTVPATRNASAAADDTLITLDGAGLNNILQGRLSRMRARGALDNNVTMTNLNLAFNEASDAYLQAKLAETGGDTISDDPAAKRGLYGILNDLSGDDLNAAITDAGLDPAALRKEAENKWMENLKASTAKAAKISPEDMTAYEGTKEILARNVELANNALNQYDARRAKEQPRNLAAGSMAFNPYTMETKGNSKDPNNRTGKGASEREKLIAARDAAQNALTNLKMPKPQFASGAKQPKFEWTEDNLRESVRGKLGEQPSAEQTAAFTKYAKEQGVTTAQDLGKLPKNDAMALAWIIASSARGASADQKVGIFDKLANYARTGDTAKSPIDANVAISGAQVGQANAITNARAVDADIANREQQRAVDWAKLGIDAQKLDRDMENDIWAKGKDVDAASNKVRDNVTEIYKGTIGAGNKIQAATPEAMIAWKNLRSDVMNLPKGSPQQIAAASSYLEGFFQMAAAQSVTPGAAAWWDVPKIIANTFMREDGMVNMSPLMETARIEYTNGKPTRVSFTDHGETGKETELVVGADEFKRFTGSSDFTTFVDAVHSQQAVNMLQKEFVPVTPENIAQVVKGIRESNGMQ